MDLREHLLANDGIVGPGLSESGRRLTRFVLADSSDELDTNPTLAPPRG
ncbi:MAG: hypothetical protein WBL31_19565 [Ilumatobacteraceae bacterium]